MTADLDTLLTALYVELTDRIIPFREPGRRGPGRPPDVTDAELACLAVAQVLLRCDDERHWPRAAPRLAGHLFPRLPAQSQHSTRLRQIVGYGYCPSHSRWYWGANLLIICTCDGTVMQLVAWRDDTANPVPVQSRKLQPRVIAELDKGIIEPKFYRLPSPQNCAPRSSAGQVFMRLA
jgi:hypothetical protein